MGNSPSTTRRNQSQSTDAKDEADDKLPHNQDVVQQGTDVFLKIEPASSELSDLIEESIHEAVVHTSQLKDNGQNLLNIINEDIYEIGLARRESEVNEALHICNLPSTDPLLFFGKWYEEAMACDGVRMVNTAALSTSSRGGRTSSRIVGVKGFDRAGFKIATNSNSLKAKNMEENPYASLLYYWEALGRMVRIDGRVTKLSEDEINKIWKGFARDAQILHTASRQDEVIRTCEEVLARKEELEQRHAADSRPLPRNPAWCGYDLIPEVWEFYQVRAKFMDRIIFRRSRPGEIPDDVILHKGKEGWVIETLSP